MRINSNIVFGLTVAFVSLTIEKIIFHVDLTILQVFIDFLIGTVAASIVKRYLKKLI